MSSHSLTRVVGPSPVALGSPAGDAISLGRYMEERTGQSTKMRYGGGLSVLVFGPNGSGKGTRLLMPNLLQMSGSSIVVVDPKGELAAVTAPYRRTLGRVVILNPFGLMTNIPGYADLKSEGFNPLAALDPEADNFNSNASLMADALVNVSGGKDPHFDESARALIAALIMHVTVEARKKGVPPTIARVRELLCQPSRAEGVAGPALGLPALAEKMALSKHIGLRNKAAQFVDWNREIQSIASTAKRQTESFDDPEIAADLAKGTFDFRELKREPTTVYLILPPEMMGRHSKWLRLVLTAAIQGVLRVRNPGEPKTLFMIDEFFALGHLEIISTVWALVRGYGVQFMPILQDLNQLKKLYPDMHETFIGMAGAVASFPPNDLTTAEWLSRRAGEKTIAQFGYNSGTSTSNTGDSSSSGYSFNAIKQPLIPPHKLLGWPEGSLLVTLSGESNVIPAYAPTYHSEILQCMQRDRRNPYYPGATRRYAF